MKTQAPISFDALKLRLIHNDGLTTDPLLTKDGVHYLIKALAYADASFSAEIEEVLVKVGSIAVSELIKGVASDNNNVRSICVMALIRLGQDAEDALVKAYYKYSRKPQKRWVFEFIFQELNLPLPLIQWNSQAGQVVSLNKAG